MKVCFREVSDKLHRLVSCTDGDVGREEETRRRRGTENSQDGRGTVEETLEKVPKEETQEKYSDRVTRD